MANLKSLPTIVLSALIPISLSIPAQALNFLGNLPLPNETLTTTVDSLAQFAFRFDTPMGTDYILDSIDLRLLNYNTADGDIALLQIFEDTTRSIGTNTPPPLLLVPLTFINPASSSDALNTFTFRPSTDFTFKANARYWLVADAAQGAYSFRLSNPQTAYTSDVGVSTILTLRSVDNGLSYDPAVSRPGLRINATAVPFPFHGGVGLTIVMAADWLARRCQKAPNS